jgi:hypothetical protein
MSEANRFVEARKHGEPSSSLAPRQSKQIILNGG